MGLPAHSAFQIAELPDEPRGEELPCIEQPLDEAARQRPELQAALARTKANRSAVAGGWARPCR